jgi:hypothetical protein
MRSIAYSTIIYISRFEQRCYAEPSRHRSEIRMFYLIIVSQTYQDASVLDNGLLAMLTLALLRLYNLIHHFFLFKLCDESVSTKFYLRFTVSTFNQAKIFRARKKLCMESAEAYS